MIRPPWGVRWTGALAVLTTATLLPAAFPGSTYGEETRPQYLEASGRSGTPGTMIWVRGSCKDSGIADRQRTPRSAEIRLTWQRSELRKDYAVTRQLPIGPDGVVGGTVKVPGDAPGGKYRISFACTAPDAIWNAQSLGYAVTGGSTPARIHRAALSVSALTAKAGGSLDLTGHCRLFGEHAAGVRGQFAMRQGGRSVDTGAFTVPAAEGGIVTARIGVPGYLPAGRSTLFVTCSKDGVDFGGRFYDLTVTRR